MPRRFFRKLIPSEEKMRQNRALRVFGSTLLNRRLWHLNRHSSAWGVACGLFWAWIAVPLQTVGAVATAIIGRGNVPLAMAFTWISNPITWIPCFWLGYKLGIWITGAPGISGFDARIREIMSAGMIDGLKLTTRLITEDTARIWPMFLGGALLGLVSAAIGYVTVKFAWRWNIVRRWQHRHQTRTRMNPAHRITSGFAHLARKAHLTGRSA